jgi:hypothetical protein
MRRMKHRLPKPTATLAGALALSLIACASTPNEAPPQQQEGRRVLGVIDHHGDPVRVEAPAEVARGTDFQVAVVTYGGGCVREGDTDVEIDGLRAVVAPFDIDVSGPGVFCTMELRQFRHTATLRFDRPGTATIIFRGRRVPEGDVVSVERTVRVR